MRSLSRSFSPVVFTLSVVAAFMVKLSHAGHGHLAAPQFLRLHGPLETFVRGFQPRTLCSLNRRQPAPKGKRKLLEEEGISLRGLAGLEGFLLFYKRCFIASKYQEKPPRHLLARREGLPWTGTSAVSTAQSSDQTLPGLSPLTERLCPLSPVTAGDAGSAGPALVSSVQGEVTLRPALSTSGAESQRNGRRPRGRSP